MQSLQLPIFALAAGVNALILLAVSVAIVPHRLRARVNLGAGSDDRLLRATRAQANAAEYIPTTLLLLFIAEASGQPAWLCWAVAGLLTLGRALHPFALYYTTGSSRSRQLAMTATWLALLIGALAALHAGAAMISSTPLEYQ